MKALIELKELLIASALV